MSKELTNRNDRISPGQVVYFAQHEYPAGTIPGTASITVRKAIVADIAPSSEKFIDLICKSDLVETQENESQFSMRATDVFTAEEVGEIISNNHSFQGKEIDQLLGDFSQHKKLALELEAQSRYRIRDEQKRRKLDQDSQ